MEVEDSLIGRTIHSNIHITRLIGEGGMGRVYLAHNVELPSKRYAVKVLRPELTQDPSFAQRFYDEACNQAEMDHPNIVKMSDYFHIDGQYFLILEFVEGRALSDVIDSRQSLGGLTEKQALSYIKDVLAGLNHAHQRAIVHRDVKPSNVLVDGEDRARITDFGIAKRVDGLTRTSRGQVIGTLQYMSPEQMSGSGAIDHRSDVYSAGIILFEMLTGKLPFSGSSFEAVRAVQSGVVPDPRDINPRIKRRLSEIVQRALQRDPNQRFQGCNQFRQAITDYESRGMLKYYVLAACILIAAGIYAGMTVFWSMPLINDTVRVAAHQYNDFCREHQRMVHNRHILELAKQIGSSSAIDTATAQIGKSESNMAASVKEYGTSLQGLTKINHKVIDYVLRQADPNPDTAKVRPVLQGDYLRLIDARTLPDHDSMLNECAALGWKTQ